ncbi:MAG TPA: hypothetical protein VJC08_02455, partial [bacterium]|nr:hypothetical protein [bacterium]
MKFQNYTGYKNKVSTFLINKTLVAIITFLFTYTQIVPISMAFTPAEQYPTSQELYEPAQQAQSQTIEAAPLITPITSDDFLQQELVLQKSTEESQDSTGDVTESQTQTDSTPENPVDENNPFVLALNHLFQQTKDIAVVVVKNVQSFSLENLKYIVTRAIENSVEIGISVVKGIFTAWFSKQADTLTVSKTAQEVLDSEETQVLAHIQSKNQIDPSLKDLEGAAIRGREEQVLSINNQNELTAVSYTGSGITSSNAVDDFLAQVNAAIDPLQQSLAEVEDWAVRAMFDPSRVYYRSDPPTDFSSIRPILSSFASTSPQGTITVNQTSGSLFNMDYNVLNGSFVGTIIDFRGNADFTTLAGNKFTFNMSRNNNDCAFSNCVKVEFVDSANRVAAVVLQGLTTTMQQVDISKSVLLVSNPSLDFTQIKQINFVQDGNFPTVGILNVETKGLDFTPVVSGTTFDSNTLTVTPNLPLISAAGGRTNPADAADGIGTVSQVSSSEFNFNYNLNGGASDFAFATVDIPGANGGALPINFVLGLNGPNGAKAKVEIKDTTGKTAKFLLNLAGSLKNYTLTLSGDVLPSGFDISKIDSIAIVMDRGLANSTGNTGTLNVRVAGLDYAPVITGTTFDANTLTTEPNFPGISAGGGRTNPADASDGLGTVSQVSSGEFNFSYDLNGGASNFAFATIDIPGANGGTLPDSFVIGLNGPNGAKAKVEVKDATGKIADFYLTLTGTLKNYTLTLSGDGIPAGFDRTKVDVVNVVMDRGLTNFTGNTGTLNVRTLGLDYAPVITGTTFDANTLTTEPNFPGLSAGGGRTNPADAADGIGTVSQISSSEFNFGYNLNGGASDFAFAAIDIPGANGGTLPASFVIGLNGPNGAKAKVEVKDTAGLT